MSKASVSLSHLGMFALYELQQELAGKKFRKARKINEMIGVEVASFFDTERAWKKEISRGVKQLAAAIQGKKFTSFAKLECPKMVEQSAVWEDPDTNLCLRLVKAYDVRRGKMFLRLDVAGRTA